MEQKTNDTNDQAESRELTSWKEIATYLRVNVRTAQKWERDRGLPVRRRAGSRGRVSAETAKLDAWKGDIISKPEDRCYRWPLSVNVTAEVNFIGGSLKAAHVELLRDYLNLVKTAL